MQLRNSYRLPDSNNTTPLSDRNTGKDQSISTGQFSGDGVSSEPNIQLDKHCGAPTFLRVDERTSQY